MNAVDHFMERLYRGNRDVRDLKGVRLCAVGPSTRDRLARYGVRIDLVPTDFRAEGVVEALSRITPLAGTRFLLPRADVGRERLAEALRSAGAEVTDVVAYRTLPAEPDPDRDPDIYRMLLDREIDVVTFTSAASVRNFAHTFGRSRPPTCSDRPKWPCAARSPPRPPRAWTFPVSIMPAEYTVGALVQAIADHYANRTHQ